MKAPTSLQKTLIVAGTISLVGLIALTAVAGTSGREGAQLASRTVDTGITPWKTVAASGPVEARYVEGHVESWLEVTRGDALLPETEVRTGPRGRATLTRNSNLLILDPDSRVELPGTPGEGDVETTVIQTSGSVLYEVDGRKYPHFEVRTPYLVAGVKGTRFLVTVSERYTSVTVERGLVEITQNDSDDVLEVRAGESVIRDRDEVAVDLVDSLDRRATRREAKRLDRMVREDLPTFDTDQSDRKQDRRRARRDVKRDGRVPVWVDNAQSNGPRVHDAQASAAASDGTSEEVTSEQTQDNNAKGIGSGVDLIDLDDPADDMSSDDTSDDVSDDTSDDNSGPHPLDDPDHPGNNGNRNGQDG